jgi:hypothetical protein
MTDSGMKEKLAATKQLFGSAASLAKKKAALAALNNVTLPKIYYAIGKRLAGLAQLPPELVGLRDKIQSLEAQIAAVPAKETSEAATGLAAKAKQLAQQAAKATSDAAATAQIHAAYVSLGKAAIDKYGDKCVPKEVLPDLQQANRSIAELKEEIAALGAASGKGLVTPRRLLLGGGLGTAVLLCFLFLGFPHRKNPTAETGTTAAKKPVADNALDSGGANPALDKMRADTQRKLAAIKKGGDINRFRSQMESKLHGWQKEAERLKGSLLREQKILAKADDSGSGGWGNLAHGKEQALLHLYNLMWKQLRSDFDARTGNDAQLEGAAIEDFTESLAAFSAACDVEIKKLSEAREAAIDEINTFRSGVTASKRSAEAELEKLHKAEETRWKNTASSLHEPIATDPAVARLEKPTDPAGFAELASNAQIDMTQALSDEQDRVRSALDGIRKDGVQRLRDAGSEREIRQVVDVSQQRAVREVSESLSRLTSRRQQALAMLSKVIAREAEQKAEAARQAAIEPREFIGPDDLDDETLKEILRAAPNITDLLLRKCKKLSNACVSDIAKLARLRKLHLPESSSITVDGLRPLRGKQIEFVWLPEGTLDSEEGFAIFASMLADASVSQPHFYRDAFHGMGGGWDLYPAKIGDAALTSLRGVSKIRSLGTPKTTTDEGLAAISHIPDVEVLYVTLNKEISDKGIGSLAKCGKLKLLVLVDDRSVGNSDHRENRSGSRVGAAGLRGLKGLGLLGLDLPGHMHTEECFEPFLDALRAEDGPRPNIRNAGVSRYYLHFTDPRDASDGNKWPCTPKTMKAMAGKAGIRKVEIEKCDADEDALAALGDLPDLEELHLKRVGTNGAGLRWLARAPKLRSVSMVDCEHFTDEALEGIANSQSVTELHVLTLPRITDVGALLLGKCKSLRRVLLDETACTPLAKVKLENLLPDATVSVLK